MLELLKTQIEQMRQALVVAEQQLRQFEQINGKLGSPVNLPGP